MCLTRFSLSDAVHSVREATISILEVLGKAGGLHNPSHHHALASSLPPIDVQGLILPFSELQPLSCFLLNRILPVSHAQQGERIEYRLCVHYQSCLQYLSTSEAFNLQAVALLCSVNRIKPSSIKDTRRFSPPTILAASFLLKVMRFADLKMSLNRRSASLYIGLVKQIVRISVTYKFRFLVNIQFGIN